MASLTQWTWVWVNSGSWWRTGRPGKLRFMGSRRVGHDWATELNWSNLNYWIGQKVHLGFSIDIMEKPIFKWTVWSTQYVFPDLSSAFSPAHWLPLPFLKYAQVYPSADFCSCYFISPKWRHQIFTGWTGHVYYCCLVTELCPTLWDPIGCSLPGSSIHGIFQVRILEWAAISFSRGSFQPRQQSWTSCMGRWILYHWTTRDIHHWVLV